MSLDSLYGVDKKDLANLGGSSELDKYIQYDKALDKLTINKDFDLRSNRRIVGLPDPNTPLQATNKQYVDGIRNKFNRYLKWGDYGNNKSITQNISTYNFNLDNWIAGGVRGEYILIIKGNGKEYTFNFNLFDGLQNNGDKVVAQFAIPKEFDTIDLTNGQAIVGNETTHFWVITNGNNMKLKFQNAKNTNARIELWRKTYEPY